MKIIKKIRARIRYYAWCFSYWKYEKFSGTFIDRLFWLFTDRFLDLPQGNYPMKYNDKTEEFDRFYSWAELKMIVHNLRRQAAK